jgi:hypothetical protein
MKELLAKKEADFWQLIQTANEQKEQEVHQFLIDELGKRTLDEILEFDAIFRHFQLISYSGDLWCAAYIVLGGCSDDGFDYFRAWLTSKGKEVFENALQDPDSLITAFDKLQEEDDYPEYESMLSVPLGAYGKHLGKEYHSVMDDFWDLVKEKKWIDYKDYNRDIVFNWEEGNEDSMRKICPKVFDKFWDNPLD